jgi:hypothetical protein
MGTTEATTGSLARGPDDDTRLPETMAASPAARQNATRTRLFKGFRFPVSVRVSIKGCVMEIPS